MNLTKHIYVWVILFLLTGIRAGYAFDATCNLIQTIDTSQFSPPSPDPSGLEYLPPNNLITGGDTLMIADGEVDETMQGITFYNGANMFEMTLGGSVIDTWETTSHPPNPPSFSDEAVGVAYNPSNKHLFISDDNKDRVFEIDPNTGPGGDRIYGTADDVVTSFDTRAFGSNDPEGIAYGDGVLFIADGINAEIYRVTPGGTKMGQFDTLGFGLTDAEGIGFNPDSHLLYIVGGSQDTTLFEVTTSGALLRTIDLTVVNGRRMAGLAIGPGSRGSLDPHPGVLNVYIADRRVDNDSNPTENDGKVYECDISAPPISVAPVANFSGTPTSGAAPLAVSFTDTSANSPTAWAWDFQNNGSTDSTVQNPSFTYSAAGTYTVKLTATNATGSNTVVKTNYITVSATPVAPVAAFSGTPTSGVAPLAVSFTDTSANAPTAWAWDFQNNGSTDSTVQNPSFTYSAAGTYTVKLTATNATGSNTVVKTNYITVSATPVAPVANFSGAPTSGAAPLTVSFTDSSTNSPTAWAWDFDNNGSIDSTAQNPTFVYNTTGTYTVKLTASNAAGSDPEVKTGYITVLGPAPSVSIYVSTQSKGTVSGISFENEDILRYATASGTWSLYFDGSDVSLGGSGLDTDAFDLLADGSILLSFTDPVTLPITTGGTTVNTLIDDSDIVRFIPTSLGPTTAGTFQWYFDGSDVGLVDSGEDIDAIHSFPDGRLVISTTGSPGVTGVTGGQDEDLLVFNGSFGELTSGTWAMYFDGSDVALSQHDSEDVDGTSIDGTTGRIYLTTVGAFDVKTITPGVSGDGNDIFTCVGSTGVNTTCTYSLFWDGGANGLGTNNVDAIDVQ